MLARLPRLAARFLPLDAGELGRIGEELALRALVRRGWRVLGRRVASGRAEVDLLMHDGVERVAVEVKTGRRVALPRPAGAPVRLPPGPADRLGAAQAARLARAARRLGARRVDLVEVELRAGRVTIRHRPDALRPRHEGTRGEGGRPERPRG